MAENKEQTRQVKEEMEKMSQNKSTSQQRGSARGRKYPNVAAEKSRAAAAKDPKLNKLG